MRLVSPPLTHDRRVPAAVFLASFIALLYELPLHIRLVRPTRLVPSPIDLAIPFIEWTVWIYASYFVFLFLPFLVCRDKARAARVFWALIANSVVAASIFLAWPTSGVAQQPATAGLSGLLWRALLFVDRPGNLLPSLHVANTCVCALALARERSAWRVAAPVWAALIVISTLTTRQHFFVDVPTGGALGVCAFWLFGRPSPRR